jgi:hypothetical protein
MNKEKEKKGCPTFHGQPKSIEELGAKSWEI